MPLLGTRYQVGMPQVPGTELEVESLDSLLFGSQGDADGKGGAPAPTSLPPPIGEPRAPGLDT